MRHLQCATAIALALFAPYQATAAQEQATDQDQRLIELVASRFVVDSLKHVFKDYAVDPRLYIRGIPRPGQGGRLEVQPKIPTPSSITSSSHTSEHMESLVHSLGASRILSDGGLCIPGVPDLCRYGNHRGLVTFSAAWLRGDSADVVVSIWERSSSTDPKTGVRTEVARAFQRVISMVRSNRTWVVRDFLTIT